MHGLGPLEAQVMDVVWSSTDSVTVRDVLAGLPGRQLAYTTVMTVLDKLHHKGWLVRDMVGRAYAYQPVQSREAYCARLMTEVLTTSRDSQATLVRFVEAMPDELVVELRQALARPRNGRRPARSRARGA